VKKVDGSWKLARVTRKRLETFLVNEDVSKIDDVTTRWFNLADEVAGLSASKVDADFASKVAATTTPDVQVTATRSVVDNAYPAGRSGAIQYLKDIASRVTSSLALLSNKVYTYTDPNTVEVEARYTGFEQLRTGETREYYGIRHYTVKRADGETWLVSKVRRERHITVVDNSEIEEIDQVSTEWFNLADEVAGKDPKDVVAEFADEVEKTTTSDVVVIVKNSLIPDETFRGRKGALNYLASVAKSVEKSGAVLANREFKWESPSRVVVSGRYTGYEHVKGGDYHTYWGTRTYTVDKQTDGSWKISQVTRIREVTLQATVAKN
jgi:ketosteroid isomerase-like protein